eukprot:CAMPEP_0204573636 /NCGR_PEP_ID=MMETSP0661-20131031/40137_1 /ASSEMBLY_ACC=CAM_ASM_000606 /TAXON_ID=109239 /ORGANISM="Alexandrium margalefi, Strain AMGDE01CS-322" /LENGTH=478 /DNA_ID=CAMNT_0051582091 /DNA_START=62 /DNA_END=1498 /DNA_ORIENTATION=-
MGPWNGCAKYDLSVVAAACYQGDLDMLDMLLFTGDAENKYPGDINTHVTDMTPLMYAAQNGQIEAVELMLKAGADPHMKMRMPYGTDPSEGQTATDLAAKMGYDDVKSALEKAAKEVAPHKYKRYGKDNNARLVIYETGETGGGKSPFAAVQVADYVPGAAKKKREGPPPTTVGLLFPGQGSQYVKMMSGLKDNTAVKEMIAKAKSVLGYDVLDICLNGPEDKLEETSVCQPAMFLAGMAGLEKLKQTRPEVVERPGCVAGLSLGEYTALCAAGVFTFEEGMELVKVRGAAMAEAAKSKPQAMLSVAGLEQQALEKLCSEQAKGDEVCQIANVLFPKGFSCAGTQGAINKLKDAAEKAGAMQAKLLKTSGGFHTSLMEPAKKKLEEALNKLAPKMKPPTCDIYMNTTGKKIKAGTSPSELGPLLAKQLCNPVLWEPSVRLMIKDGMTEFYEVGPMKQLKAMMKRIDPSMWNSTSNVEV